MATHQHCLTCIVKPFGLCAGEVPNLFARDELPGVLEEIRAASKQAGAGETPDQLYNFFLSRVKANLHVILCISPAGDAFSRRCRMFPGLTTFSPFLV